MQYDDFITHSIDMYMGRPKSGKTLIAGSYPKPMLYVSVGSDGGGRVLVMKYNDDIQKGLIKVKNLRNDALLPGKRIKTSIEKLAELLRDLRQPDADKFKTIIIDTVGALQDDYKNYLEFSKGGRSLSRPEWGDVSKMMLSIKDNMTRFSEEMNVTFVWVTHTSEQELYETSGLNKELRLVPDLTVKTGMKFMKDASNIFYCCRKTVINTNGEKGVKFLTYAGPHPLIDSGTRDIMVPAGNFIENFSYDKWLEIVKTGSLDAINILSVDSENEDTNKNAEDGEKE